MNRANCTWQRAVERAFWDSDHESMKNLLLAYKPLADTVIKPRNAGPAAAKHVAAAEASRQGLQAACERLAARIAELKGAEDEELAALASTRQLERCGEVLWDCRVR